MGQARTDRTLWARGVRAAATWAATAMLVACGTVKPPEAEAPMVATAPPPAPSAEPAGVEPPLVAAPKPEPAPKRSAVPPDAKPRVERIAQGPPNHPYSIKGVRYTPHDTDLAMSEIGVASWYGEPFHGRAAATGERYDMDAMTAAHPTMPLPSYARVRNLRNGREVIVRVNDRGPFVSGRIIDLSRAAARRLGFSGLAMVEVTRLTNDDIRTGAWRERGRTAVAAQATPLLQPLARPTRSVRSAVAQADQRTDVASTR